MRPIESVLTQAAYAPTHTGTIRDQFDWFETFHHLVLWPEPKEELDETDIDPLHPDHEPRPELPRFLEFTDVEDWEQPERHFWRAQEELREPLDPVVEHAIMLKRMSTVVEDAIGKHRRAQERLWASEAERAAHADKISDEDLQRLGIKPDVFRTAEKTWLEFQARRAEVKHNSTVNIIILY